MIIQTIKGKINFLKKAQGAEEMAQQVRALVALAEDISHYISCVIHNHLKKKKNLKCQKTSGVC